MPSEAPQLRRSAPLRPTLLDSYATVVSPVAQGPKRPFRDRSASWGISSATDVSQKCALGSYWEP